MGTCARARSLACAWLCWASPPGHCRSARRRPQAAGHLCRNRPLRHGRHRARHRLPAGQARAQIQRLGQDGGDFCRSRLGPRHSHRRSRRFSRTGAQALPARGKQEPPQMLAYRELPDAQLFSEQWVRVAIDPADLPGQSRRARRLPALRRGSELRAVRHGQWRVSFASPAPVPSFATGSRFRRKIDHARALRVDARHSMRRLSTGSPFAVLFAPPIPKHPNHKADCQTYGNQPKRLLTNFNRHGDDSPFRPPRRAAFIAARTRESLHVSR